MGRRGRAYVAEAADRSVAFERYRALLAGGRRRDRRRRPLLDLARRARVDARRLPARSRSLLARMRPRPFAAADELPTVTVIVAAHDEESVIERRIANLLALDYPRRQARDRRHLRRLDRRDRGAGRARRRARDPQPARRQGRRAGPRRARDRERGARLLRRQRDVGARRARAASCGRSPTRTSPTSAAGCASSAPTARTGRASTGATSSPCAAPSRGSARSPAATARSTRCAAPTTSRSTRASGTTSRCRT